MNYTVYKALRIFDPGKSNMTFVAPLGDIGAAILSLDSSFDNTVENTVKQIQGAVNSGYNCYEMQLGGHDYVAFLDSLTTSTELNFYKSRDLEYMANQSSVLMAPRGEKVDAGLTVSVEASDEPSTEKQVTKKDHSTTSKRSHHKK